MIKEYKNNYSKYFQDQITKFESFEKDLYAEGIKNTIDFIFKDYNPEFNRVLDFCCGDGTGSGTFPKSIADIKCHKKITT